jgi:hypothetical protein
LAPVNGNLYQESVQNPCIFSNQSCKNPASFPSTDVPNGGSVTTYDLTSPSYSGADLLAIIGAGNPLTIGIDINEAGGQPPQTLTTFEMLVNGSVVDTYSGTKGNVPDQNNGNGYADYLLSGFSSFLSTDSISFHVLFNDATDGPENWFVIGGTSSATPEPISLSLIGGGLLALGLLRRRFKA